MQLLLYYHRIILRPLETRVQVCFLFREFFRKMIGLFPYVLIFTAICVCHAFSSPPRLLQQQTFNYRANYSAEFQALRDTFCIGDAPILQVTCFSKNMTILGTSNETIVCNKMTEPLVANGTTYECINTCSSSSCESIYLANDNGKSSDGPFGSIWFMCEGNTVDEVDSALTYVGGNNGTCAAATSGSVTRNLHIGRLGVSCPVGSTREYVYDDTYFECDSAEAISFDSLVDPFDSYTCEIGEDCKGEACTVMFTDMYINAYVPKFFDTCVEATVPITGYPTPAPIPESSGLTVSVRFEASWGNLFDSEGSISTCSNENPAIILSCENGASIDYVLSTANTVNCTAISGNELRCTDFASSIINEFSSAIFECSGSRLPSARVTYSSSDAVCVGNTAASFLQHAVTLGMLCNISPSPIYFYNDLYFECADDSYNFDKPFDMYGNEGLRYMCSTSASFPASSSSADSRVIPDVAIVTDEYWLQDAAEECFTISRVPTTPVSVPISTPSPVSNSPISQITALPVIAPSIQPLSPTFLNPTRTTKIPSTQTSSPTMVQPTRLPLDNPQSTSSDSKSPIGAIAGGIVGGVAVGLLVIGFIMYQKRNDSANHNPKTNDLDQQSTTKIDTMNGQEPSSSNAADPVTSHVVTTNSVKSGLPLPVPSDGMNASLSAPAVVQDGPQYEVNYKDQSRTVIGHPQPMPVVDGLLVQTQIPFAVAMDMSGASGGSNTTKSEPPGRRVEEA